MWKIVRRPNGALFFVIALLLVDVRVFAASRTVTICVLEHHWEQMLNSELELRGNIVVGGERGFIVDQDCRFPFAFGSDYQTFGNRYRATTDAEWALMWSALNTRPDCPVNERIVRARMRGTLIRQPRTGTIPQNEMGPEFVIRRVFEVTQVPIVCNKE